jgi:hypothetical protein
VVVVQHATGTCCRGRLAKWHGIPAGKIRTADEQEHVVPAVGRWLSKQASTGRAGAQQALPLF